MCSDTVQQTRLGTGSGARSKSNSMRQKACRRSMFTLKQDTMHPSSRNLLLIALFCLICATLVGAQATQNQQNQQQPVQDLTPPSDAEAEKLATPPPAPNVSSDTTKVAVPEVKKGAGA